MSDASENEAPEIVVPEELVGIIHGIGVNLALEANQAPIWVDIAMGVRTIVTSQLIKFNDKFYKSDAFLTAIGAANVRYLPPYKTFLAYGRALRMRNKLHALAPQHPAAITPRVPFNSYSIMYKTHALAASDVACYILLDRVHRRAPGNTTMFTQALMSKVAREISNSIKMLTGNTKVNEEGGRVYLRFYRAMCEGEQDPFVLPAGLADDDDGAAALAAAQQAAAAAQQAVADAQQAAAASAARVVELQAELAASAARIAELQADAARVAQLQTEVAASTARIAELEQQLAQQQPAAPADVLAALQRREHDVQRLLALQDERGVDIQSANLHLAEREQRLAEREQRLEQQREEFAASRENARKRGRLNFEPDQVPSPGSQEVANTPMREPRSD